MLFGLLKNFTHPHTRHQQFSGKYVLRYTRNLLDRWPSRRTSVYRQRSNKKHPLEDSGNSSTFLRALPAHMAYDTATNPTHRFRGNTFRKRVTTRVEAAHGAETRHGRRACELYIAGLCRSPFAFFLKQVHIRRMKIPEAQRHFIPI